VDQSGNVIANNNITAANGTVTGIGLVINPSSGYLNWQGAATTLYSDAGGTLAQRSGTTAQAHYVYNTFTDSSNYERAVFDWTTSSNKLTIGVFNAGTGSARQMQIVTNNNLDISTNGASDYVIYRIGTNANNSAGGFQLTNSATVGWGSGFANATADTGVSRSAAGVIAFGNGAQGDGSACIQAKTKAGAPTTTDVPASTWALIRDTTNATTKIYYNNAGTLMSVALA
jgi:hypothetical protein